MDVGIRFLELLAYAAEENRRWKQWFSEHPEALDLPCDIAKCTSVREFIFHIFVADLFYANRVSGLEIPDFKALPHATVAELFAVEEDAAAKFQSFVASARQEDWDQTLPLRSIDYKASKRKMLTQALLHGVQHRAQLATLLRQQGLKPDWIHDFVLSAVMP